MNPSTLPRKLRLALLASVGHLSLATAWSCSSSDSANPPPSPSAPGGESPAAASQDNGAPSDAADNEGAMSASTLTRPSTPATEGVPSVDGSMLGSGMPGAQTPNSSAPDEAANTPTEAQDSEDMPTAPADPSPPEVTDERPWFSFFAASQVGMFSLPAGEFSPAPDPVDGFGGNFGGLAGADEICTMLARQGNPTDTKTWRAFLSTSGFQGGPQVDAIDRIGEGPWFDFSGRLFAETLDGLLPGGDGRPADADAQLAEMFSDEYGDAMQPNNQVDNHDTLTGSNSEGRLYTSNTDNDGRAATCEDWTSNTLQGQQTGGGGPGGGGPVPVGHSWPRNNNNGRQWIQEHTVRGCEAGANTTPGGGAPQGDFTVGAGGGFGGIYCFALGAVPPDDE